MQNLQAHAKQDYPTSPTNGNGNGAAPPEETRQELLKEIAPQIRRRVREDPRLSAGAKFLFFALLDDCFWHKVGGHGTGRIFDTLRRLAGRYRHNKDTIADWRDELIECEWLYCRDDWPLTEWRLTPLMPAPESSPHQAAVQMSLGRAAKEDEEVVRKNPPTPSNGAKPAFSAKKTGSSGEVVRKNAPPCPEKRATSSEGSGQCVRRIRTQRRENPDKLAEGSGQGSALFRTRSPKDPDTQTGKTLLPPPIPAHPLGQNGHGEKSPGVLESGVTKEKEGKAPPASQESGEKIFWNGRHWFPSALHKQLSLLDQAIARTQGVQRRELVAFRNSLLGALGIPTPTARTATPAALMPATPAKILPKAELDKWMTGLRKALE